MAHNDSGECKNRRCLGRVLQAGTFPEGTGQKTKPRRSELWVLLQACRPGPCVPPGAAGPVKCSGPEIVSLCFSSEVIAEV